MDWRREYLPPVDDGGLPWRPLLEGEPIQEGDESGDESNPWNYGGELTWIPMLGCGRAHAKRPRVRTRRPVEPLPAEEKPGEPEDEDDGPMRSSIGSVLSELQEFDQPLGRNYYLTVIHGVEVDVYDILAAYDVTSHPVAHALKKLLRLGKGHKSPEQDVQEAIASLQRHLELYAQTTPPHNP